MFEKLIIMRKVIGIGETVFDIIFRNDQPTAGVPGGSTFNAMISLGRTLGVQCPNVPLIMVTETGSDHIGDIIVNFMSENHVSTEAVTRNPGQSHISLAFLNENNDAQYAFYKDHANAKLHKEQILNIKYYHSDIVLFGSFFAINPVIRKYTKEMLTAASEAGALLYYDINFRASHIKDIPDTLGNIQENCRLSSVVRGSAEDFGYLFGTTSPEEIYEKHIKEFCPYFICTDGGRPAWVFTPNFTLQIPVAPIQTISTIGAGDNFNAGFLYALVSHKLQKTNLPTLSKEDWQKIVGIGQQFSAAVCQSINNYVDVDFIQTL